MFRILIILAILPLCANDQLFEICDRYKRHFSILNLHADDGETAFLLAQKYPHAVIVMSEQDIGIDQKKASALLNKCKKGPQLPNLILLSGRLNIDDLMELSQSEHFDIILCGKSPYDLQYPNHITPKQLITHLLKLSSTLIIAEDLYPSEEKTDIEKGLLFRSDAPKITYTYSLEDCITYGNHFETEKIYGITKCPGISLIAFLAYRGIWPDPEGIKKQLKYHLISKNYPRATPWNTIISGEVINFNIPPNKAPYSSDPLSPTLWEIFDLLFESKSKREMRELIQTNYFD